MLSKVWLLLCCYGLLSCGPPAPSFNPFDEVFEIDVEALYQDSTLEVVGDCMAFNLSKNQGEHSTYYGVYTNIDSVVSKGMIIPLPTPRPVPMVLNYSSSKLDTFQQQLQNQHRTKAHLFPYDTVKVDSILKLYDLTRAETFSKWNTFFGQEDFFLVCENSQGQEYVFEYQYDPFWLGKAAFGKKALVFDTNITKESLELDYQYH